MARFAGKAGGSLSELAAKIENYTARYGEDMIPALRRVGPDAFALVDEAGVDGSKAARVMAMHGEEGATWVVRRPQAMKQFLRYGDDAAAALVKHPGVAEPLIESEGLSAVKALESVTTRNGRRIAMCMEGDLGKLARHKELLDVVSLYGDRAAQFIWANKEALAVGTTLAAFLANPEAFINGVAKLAGVVGETAAKPLAEGIARDTNWTPVVLIALAAAIGFGLLVGGKMGLFMRWGGRNDGTKEEAGHEPAPAT